jgi:hypothetical protein
MTLQQTIGPLDFERRVAFLGPQPVGISTAARGARLELRRAREKPHPHLRGAATPAV